MPGDREWYDKKDSELVETRMAPSASTDDMQSTQLPKSEGTKRKLVERFPALKLVIEEWNQCWRFALKAAWAGDYDAVSNDDVRNTLYVCTAPARGQQNDHFERKLTQVSPLSPPPWEAKLR